MKNFSVALRVLSLAVLPMSSLEAAFVYHDSATTTGGQFNPTFPLTNLKNAGHTSPLDTESGASVAQSYASANTTGNPYPITITLDFVNPISLDTFYVWNHTNNNGPGAPANGMGNFSLTFFSGPNGTGSQIGSVFSDSAAAAPTATGLYAAEVFGLGAVYADVRSINLVVTSKVGGVTTGWFAVREIGFNQIPEPASALLGGLGLLTLLRRRR
jgi:hypothetical protein